MSAKRHLRRLDRVEYRLGRINPGDSNEVKLRKVILAMTPADRTEWDRLAEKYDDPVDNYPDPETTIDPEDRAVMTAIIARAVSELGHPITEAQVASEVARYRALYDRRVNGEQAYHRGAMTDD